MRRGAWTGHADQIRISLPDAWPLTDRFRRWPMAESRGTPDWRDKQASPHGG